MKFLLAISSSRVTVSIVFLLLLYAGPHKPRDNRIVHVGNIDFNKGYFAAGRTVRRTGTVRLTRTGFANIPIMAYACAPFAPEVKNDTRFSPKARTLGGTWFLYMELACHALSFALCLLFFAKTAGSRWALVIFFGGFRPYYTSLILGQWTGVCLLLIIAVLILYIYNRGVFTGMFLALAFLLKIPAGVLFWYFVWKRRWLAVISSMVVYLFILGLSFYLFGPKLHQEYYQVAAGSRMGKTLTGHHNVGIHAVVTRLMSPDGEPAVKRLRNFRMIKIPTLANWLIIAGILWLFAFIAWLVGRDVPTDELDKRLEFSVVICALLLIFPIVWDHYYEFLVIPLITCYEAMRRRRTPWHEAVILFTAFCLANLPVGTIYRKYWTDPKYTDMCYLIASAPFFAGILMLYLAVSQLWRRRLAVGRT